VTRASAMPAAAVTSDSVWGCAVLRCQVRSTTPMISPVSGSWIGAPGALPGMRDAVEVLGGEDLDRVVAGDRVPERVRSRPPLAPIRAADEAHVLRGLDHALVALDPQQHAARVAHDEHLAGRVVASLSSRRRTGSTP